MQVVINIESGLYEWVHRQLDVDEGWSMVQDAIMNGTPLPKGHGRLIDELDLDLFAPSLGTDEYVNELMAKHNIDYVNGDDEDKVRTFAIDLIHSCMNVIKTAPTIIEVDRYEFIPCVDKNNVHIIKEI